MLWLRPRSVEQAVEDPGNEKHRDQGPEHRLVSLPMVPDGAGNRRTEHTAPDIEHAHIAADFGEVFAAEKISDQSPGNGISRFHRREQQNKNPEEADGAAEDRTVRQIS